MNDPPADNHSNDPDDSSKPSTASSSEPTITQTMLAAAAAAAQATVGTPVDTRPWKLVQAGEPLDILRADFSNFLPWYGTLTALAHLHGGVLGFSSLTSDLAPLNPTAVATATNLKFAIRSLVDKALQPAVDRFSTPAQAITFLRSQAPPPELAIESIHEEASRTMLIPGQLSEYIRAHTEAHEAIVAADPNSHFASCRIYIRRMLGCIDTSSDPELSAWAAAHRNRIDLKHKHVLDLHRMLRGSHVSRADPRTAPMAFGAGTTSRRNYAQRAPTTGTRYAKGSCVHHPESKTHTTSMCRQGPRSVNRTPRRTTPNPPTQAYSVTSTHDTNDSFDSSIVSEQAASIAELTAQIQRLHAANAQLAAQASVNDKSTYTPFPTILDSGATDHFGPPNLPLHNARPSKAIVTVADGRNVRVRRTGSITIPTAPHPLTIHAHATPGFHKLLLSVPKLALQHDILFTGRRAHIYPIRSTQVSAAPLASATTQDGLYQMDKPPTATKALSVNPTPITPALLIAPIPHLLTGIHKVFNHVAPAALKRLARLHPTLISFHKHLAQPVPSDGRLATCPPCHISRQKRAPFTPRPTPTRYEPLEKVSHDTTGPLLVSHKGHRYLHAIVDRASRYMAVIPLPSRAAVPAAAQTVLASWSVKLKRPITRLHADNAPELHAPSLANPLAATGTDMSRTARHSSAQNGQAEHVFSTIFNAVRAALASSALPKSYWDWASLDAADKHNHLPSSVYPHSPPATTFHGTPQTIPPFHAFGQLGWATETTSTGHHPKLAPRATMVYYLRAPNCSQIIVAPVLDNGKIGTARAVRAAEFQPHVSITPKHTQPTPPPIQDTAHLADTTIPLLFPPEPILPAPKNLREARRHPDAALWGTAYDAEVRRFLVDLQAVEFIDRAPGDTPRPTNMGFKLKPTAQGRPGIRKARLSVRGDLMTPDREFNSTATSSHAPSHAGRRLMLASAAAMGYSVQSWDVPGAYPRAPSDPDYRQTMHQPSLFDGTFIAPGKICLIKRAMPGTPDAGRRWAIYRDARLLSWGWHRSSFESGLFYRKTASGQPIWLLADTDDFLLLGPDHDSLQQLRQPFTRDWQVTVQRLDPITPTIQHAGLSISLSNNGLKITNPRNVSNLLRAHEAETAHPRLTPWPIHTDLTALKPDERGVNSTNYASIVGALRFLADTSHPLLSFAVQKLATALQNPGQRHLTAAHHLLAHLRLLVYDGPEYNRQHDGRIDLIAYSDSDYATCIDTRRSVTGIMTLANTVPVAWSSRRQTSVVGSTTEAELTAAATASRDVRWLANLAHEVYIPLTNELTQAADGTRTPVVTLCVDNKGAVDIANGTGPTKASRHMAVRSMLLQEQVRRNQLRIRQVPTTHQLADAMTKLLGPTKFRQARDALGLTLASSPPRVEGRETTHRQHLPTRTGAPHSLDNSSYSCQPAKLTVTSAVSCT